MTTYRMGSILVHPDQPDFASLLEEAYKARLRPMCMCKGEPGLPMYIANINSGFYLKRMPNTGRDHAVGCVSWEMPEQFSGRADLGSGIRVEGDNVLLKLGFPLAKQGSHLAPEPKQPSAGEKLSVNNGGKRLSLQGLLHMLWDDAGLNKWQGSEPGRNWDFVYSSLNLAVDGKVVKHHPLARYIYVPEPFNKEKAEEQQARRRKKFIEFAVSEGSKGYPLMLLIGEWKKLEESGIGGVRAVIKHVPGYSFAVNEHLKNRMDKYYALEMSVVKATEEQRTHLIVAGTFSLTTAGTAEFEEMAFMPVTSQWIPFDNIYELDLFRKLTDAKRSFIRPLRYNRLKEGVYMPTAVLTDASGGPTALYVVPPDRELEKYEHGSLELDFKKWFWDTRVAEMLPELPPRLEVTAKEAEYLRRVNEQMKQTAQGTQPPTPGTNAVSPSHPFIRSGQPSSGTTVPSPAQPTVRQTAPGPSSANGTEQVGTSRSREDSSETAVVAAPPTEPEKVNSETSQAVFDDSDDKPETTVGAVQQSAVQNHVVAGETSAVPGG